MVTSIVVLLGCALAASQVSPDAKPKVAVFDLKAVGEVTSDQVGVLVDRILVKIEETGRYETISRSDLNAMLGQEKLKDALGCTDTACLAEIGGAAGSDFLLTGQVSLEGGRYLILLTVIDVPTQRATKRQEFEAYGGAASLYAKAEEIVSRLFGAGAVGLARTTGDIVLVLSPAAAEYRLDGGSWQGFVAGRLNVVTVAAGEHQIEVRANGFKLVKETVFVDAGKVATAQIDLVPVMAASKSSETGWISIASHPESGADIYLDGELLPAKTPTTLKGIRVGDHHIALKKALYQPFTVVVAVKPNGLHKVEATLQENFGPVVVESRPKGAVVYFDGVNKGQTPLQLNRVEAKAHQIRLSRSLYHDLEVTVLVEPGKGFAGTYDLRPAFGTLVVNADKDGAEVLIDGQTVGSAPLTKTEIPAGRIFVKVQMSLHRSHEQYVDIVDGQTATIEAKLVEEYGVLTVDVEPKGAKVLLDDHELGATPLKKKVGVGSYRLRVDAGERYRALSKLVQIRVGVTETVEGKLEPRLGSLMIGSNAHGARVLVDGEDRGTAPVKLDGLFVGNHRVRLDDTEYEAQEQDVTVLEGGTVELEIPLRKLMPAELRAKVMAEWETTRSRYTTWGIVQLAGAGGLAIAGSVLFVIANDDKREADDLYAQYEAATDPSRATTTWSTYKDRLDSANSKALGAEVLWAVAGAALISGVTTFILSPPQPETKVMSEGVGVTTAVIPWADGIMLQGGLTW